jgi:hypothetical protein
MTGRALGSPHRRSATLRESIDATEAGWGDTELMRLKAEADRLEHEWTVTERRMTQLEALLEDARDLLWHGVEPGRHIVDCPGCKLAARINAALR